MYLTEAEEGGKKGLNDTGLIVFPLRLVQYEGSIPGIKEEAEQR